MVCNPAIDYEEEGGERTYKWYLPTPTSNPFGDETNYKGNAEATPPVLPQENVPILTDSPYSQTMPLKDQTAKTYKRYSYKNDDTPLDYDDGTMKLLVYTESEPPASATQNDVYIDNVLIEDAYCWTDSVSGLNYISFEVDMPSPKDTIYWWKIASYNAVTESLQSKTSAYVEAQATAFATSAYDVVKNGITENALAPDAVTTDKIAVGTITANKIFVEALSAISANLGAITDGSLVGNQNNYWYLSDEYAGGQLVHRAGDFRVGGASGDFISCTTSNGTDYHVEIQASQFNITAIGTVVKGDFYISHPDATIDPNTGIPSSWVAKFQKDGFVYIDSTQTVHKLDLVEFTKTMFRIKSNPNETDQNPFLFINPSMGNVNYGVDDQGIQVLYHPTEWGNDPAKTYISGGQITLSEGSRTSGEEAEHRYGQLKINSRYGQLTIGKDGRYIEMGSEWRLRFSKSLTQYFQIYMTTHNQSPKQKLVITSSDNDCLVEMPNIKADEFVGNLTGNADTATSATSANRLASISIANIRIGSVQARISLNQLMTWLITTKAYIPSGTDCYKVLGVPWDYAGNDILQLSANGVNYELQLAGCLIEFMGNATNYNTGRFRLIIHSSPTNSFTVSSGYEKFPVSTAVTYTCNGSSYTPIWKIDMPIRKANGYWGLQTPKSDGTWIETDWIRSTFQGILPYQSGNAGSGHCSLGTSSWYWKSAYIDQIHGYLNGSISGSSTSCSGNSASATTALSCSGTSTNATKLGNIAVQTSSIGGTTTETGNHWAYVTKAKFTTTSGYIVYSNGLKIQWGIDSVSGNPRSYRKSINMPLAFSNTNTYTVLISPEMWGNDTTQRIAFTGLHKKTEQIFQYQIYGNQTQDTILSCQWIAIGY